MQQTATREKILGSLGSGIVATDAGGHINYMNSEALWLLDSNPADCPEAWDQPKQCHAENK
jgi:sensor histidine kinase regulating citrate/malate metabolism